MIELPSYVKIAIVNSNYVSIGKYTKKGTEIFDYILIRQLVKLAKQNGLEITAFASGDSHLPVPVESVSYKASFVDKAVGREHHKTFEMALVSKAFSKQDEFDLYHVNIGNGDVVLPFAPFVKKPIIVTMHGSFLEEKYNKKFLTLFKNLENIYFISISDAQRKPLPELNYVETIHHGINTKRTWPFSLRGGECIMWAGRSIKEKGISTALKVIKKSGRKAKMFPMIVNESPRWIRKFKEENLEPPRNVSMQFDQSRHSLAIHFQKSKLLLFPIKWEEPFGLVMIEAMSCGTPVIAFARGSVPEVVKDGKTGFIVNPSDDDIRGNFIIKKTGSEGLLEAIERIYSMTQDDYLKMRTECRKHVVANFTVEKMASKYVEVYKRVNGLRSA